MKKSAAAPRSRGTAAPTTSGFIGFSTFSTADAGPEGAVAASPSEDAAYRPVMAAAVDPMYAGTDYELGAVMRRLSKSDVTTKLKAFQARR